MKYNRVVPGIFQKRPNRFIAHVCIHGKEEVCHVKNTGRCKELLVPGCTVYCAVSDNPNRKTKFDLIAVEKKVENHEGDADQNTTASDDKNALSANHKNEFETDTVLLINMDSQAPNAAVKEWLASGASPFGQIDLLKPECRHGNSRFDFYLECNKRKIFIEVKGVTLEDDGVVLFPDAPTERGVKHVHELIQCHGEGYETYILFVVQMERARYFTPNRKTHPEFADALCEAKQADVELLAYMCTVSPDEMKLDKPLKIKL
ncbi:MAG: DNA/RNA nuclease SfsA [Acidaminococcaceae bacterium]|nr:DNA/RNA nuclease SfsA [Acidaminococcaceae bacterium]